MGSSTSMSRAPSPLPVVAGTGHGDDVPDDEDGRRPDPVLGQVVGEGGQRRQHGALPRHGALLDHRDRRGRLAAAGEERLGDRGCVLHGHQQHHGAPHPRDGVPGDEGVGVTGWQVPRDDGELVGDTTVRDRDAHGGGHRDGGGQPRDHRDRHAGGLAGQHLLVAPAEHEAVPALEAHHPLALAGPGDDDLVDGLLGGGAAARQFGHVDQLDVGGQLVEQLARCQPVGDHDVGRGQGVPRGDRRELRVPRTPADQDHAGGGVQGGPGGQRAVAQRGHDLVADAGRPAGLAVGQDRDGEPAVAPHRRGPRGRGGRVVGTHAEDPPTLALLADGGVDLGIVGRRDDVPRVLEVPRLEAAGVPGDLTGQPLQGGGDLRGDQQHVGTGADQRRHPALRDVTTAHHDDPASSQAQSDGVRRGICVVSEHAPILPRPGPADRTARVVVRWRPPG